MMLLTLITISALPLLLLSRGGMCEEIIGGREVAPHSRPYMVYLSADCGGALIKENWVLTAAHCHRNGFVQAILGAHSINGNEKEQQIIEVEEQVVHKHYDNSNYANDIMLVKLSKKATINQYVQMLPLPTSEVDPPAGTTCSIAGWGRTEYHGKPADALQEVTVKVISRQECNRRDSYNGKVTPSMMCAGERNGRKDVCTGDSGGPLICNEIYTGIVSFGVECGKKNFPGVYTRLTDDYLHWIKRVTQY
ncbi:granzyme A-like isoform X3 [Erpetoichthys calabaricus]|uniref:Granzyme A-like n=1 Tax=Erpetoichthys calabaricus TaxID=27687 RepID=A0A8C4RLH9_ERPCA|nr:granzyme A-like isoform X3 [Erpetoichthys calabaricus]